LKLISILETIIKTFVNTPLKTPPMNTPHNHAINCLINFPFNESWFANDLKFVDKVLLIFRDTIKKIAPETGEDIVDDIMFDNEIDQCILTTIMLLKKLSADSKMRKRIREMLMPDNICRTRQLTLGCTTIHAMIRAMNSSRLLQTRDFLCEFMIALCENDGKFF
jgi:hypothetical protein